MRFQQKTPLAWLGDREWFNQSKAILSVVLPNRASGVFCWNEMLCRLTCACFYVIIHRWRLRWGYDKVEVLKKKTWTVWRKSCLINRRKESRERWISHSINLALLLMVCQWITKHIRGIFHMLLIYCMACLVIPVSRFGSMTWCCCSHWTSSQCMHMLY